MGGEHQLVEMQKRLFVISIWVDGKSIAMTTVNAYTEDMAIVRALVPEILVRLGLTDPYKGVELDNAEVKIVELGAELPPRDDGPA